MTDTGHKASFFRQSGWLMIANIAGGILMWAVHFLQKAMPDSVRAGEYGIFGVYLSVAMVLPTMSFQMVMAHQTALALATNRQRELARMIRRLAFGAFVFWCVTSVVVLVFQERILQNWHIQNPAGLWITLFVVLFSFWMPLFWGVLQGQQNFLWLGWSMMFNGVGRLSIGFFAVVVLGACSAGLMTGVVLGMALATGIAAWQTRSLWLGSSSPFPWRKLAGEAIPPLLGFAAFQFLFTADQMFVKAYFGEDQAGFYFSAGTLSRALLWLVGPLASVMFPRVVHSAAKSEKTNLVAMVLGVTAVLAAVGAACLSVLGPWVVKLVYGPTFVHDATSLLPWYAGAMVPLAVANVLLNTLLAKSSFKVVIPLCLLAAGYGFALTRFHTTQVMVLQTLGAFNLLLLLICAWFTWQGKTALNPKSVVQS